MIDLAEYIIAGDIFGDLDTRYHYTIITDIIYTIDNPSFTFLTIADVDDSLVINPDSKLLIISYSQTVHDILLLTYCLKIKPAIISLNPGVMSMRTKCTPEIDDISLAYDYGYSIIEPVSLNHLISSIVENIYIRVHDIRLPETIAQTDRICYIGHNSNYDLPCLIWPGCIETFSRADYSLYGSQSPLGIRLRPSLTESFPSELIAAIQSAGRLIVMIDHKATESIYTLLQTFVNKQCGAIHTHFIFPQYHLVSSILPDYILEEAQFLEDHVAHFLEQLSIDL